MSGDEMRRERELERLRLLASSSRIQIGEYVLPDSRQFIAGSIRLHYLDWGGDGERHALFLHGGGLNAHAWDILCLALRPRFRCIALDLRGHGDSEWSPNLKYDLVSHRDDVRALVECLGIRDFVLVGMSFGALVSLAYAAVEGDRVSQLVIVDAGPTLRVEGATRIHTLMNEPAEYDSVDAFLGSLPLKSTHDRTLVRANLLHNIHQLPNGKWTWKYDRRHRVGSDIGQLLKERSSLWSEIPRINCRTLIVRGANSDVFSDADAAALAAALPQGRWCVVPGAGHSIASENPHDLLRTIESFTAPNAGSAR